ATFTFDVTDGMAASFGWLSNGEYSFKYYPASGEIKGGGNKEKAFSASSVPQLIVVPNKIGALTTSYFTYDAKDIVTYGANDDQGVFVANNVANTTIVIPEGVTAIPQYSFAHNNIDNRNMRFVLPSTLKKIGNRAFSGYSSGGLYVSFELPEGLETIGNGAFSQCRYEDVIIPSTVTVIQDSTFSYNTRLKTVLFNGDVASIGSKSFEYCKELKSMRFKGLNAPNLKSDTFDKFVDGYEFYVYYPYNGVGYNKEWKELFPPNTHFIKIDADGNALPEENEEDPYMMEYEKMRLKWREILLAETADPTDPDIATKIIAINSPAQSYWDGMLKNEGRTKIWSNLGLTSERSLQETYERLLAMATAYATKGCQLYHNAQMLADIISAMDYIYDNGYYSSTGGGNGNWWQWQIGIPQKIIRICIILYDELSAEQKANYMSATRHFQNDITMTGANRMWECEVFIGRGIIENNAANIKVANEGISAVLGMVEGSGDGFYTDGSFIQHSIYPYNGGYGQSLFANIAEMLYILDDSPWEVTEAASSNLYDWLYKAYAPFIYKGQFMDMVRGREMARYYSDTYYIGTKIMSAMVNIADYAPERFSNEIKSMIKYWYSQNNQVDFYANMESSSIVKTKKLLNDESINPMEEPVFYKQFYNMDRAVQARPGYAVGISMYSNRIGAFESINSENQRAYHTADGMIYLYNDDLLHYHDGFWPTVNLYRLSGTTVEKNTTIASNTKGSDPWAGGVELNGKYGITSMQHKSIGQNLSAKKSYFMFDDEIVCLGSDINSSDNIQVETIVENRKLSSSSDVFIIDDAEKIGDEEEFSNVNWASIEGTSANIGYYFPSGANVKALKEQRTGGWSNVATATNDVKYTADYATMWIEHGTNPQKGTYEYVILPDKDSAATKEYTSNPHIEVLANTDEIQAAKEIRNNIIGVNFWTDGVKSIGGITSDSHGCVLTQVDDGVLSVVVSDPARTNSGWMNIELDIQANRIITTDNNVVVTQVSPTIKMSINMKSLKGATAKACFDLTGSAEYDLGKDIYIIDN
ncbi:MAG: polysaccharide lyase family 8 super-sandwich domain-containing protein, partial [Eubacteriales bacterium]|nr:polysaccharide lyase family 8 super-sandwich domain-containing protein [Eubacteriales bacterium]